MFVPLDSGAFISCVRNLNRLHVKVTSQSVLK